MSGFIVGEDRTQTTLFPERFDDCIAEDGAVRVIDVFIKIPLVAYPEIVVYRYLSPAAINVLEISDALFELAGAVVRVVEELYDVPPILVVRRNGYAKLDFTA